MFESLSRRIHDASFELGSEPGLSDVEVLANYLAAIFDDADDVKANQSKGVIPLFHESGIASSLHDVSKKDLNLGLFTNHLRSMMALNKRSLS